MTHRRGAIWTERLLLVMILSSLAGTLNLLLAIQRHVVQKPAESIAPSESPQITASTEKAVSPPISPDIPEPPIQADPPTPLPPPEDPTKKVVAGLASATAKELQAALGADRQAAARKARVSRRLPSPIGGSGAKCWSGNSSRG